jgi:hypothetical protein
MNRLGFSNVLLHLSTEVLTPCPYQTLTIGIQATIRHCRIPPHTHPSPPRPL